MSHDPEALLREAFARQQARNRVMLDRITRPKPDPDSDPLPDPASMLAAAAADMERDDDAN